VQSGGGRKGIGMKRTLRGKNVQKGDVQNHERNSTVHCKLRRNNDNGKLTKRRRGALPQQHEGGKREKRTRAL